MKNDLIASDNILDLVATSSRRKLDIIHMIASATSSSSINLAYLVKSQSSGLSYTTLSNTLKDSVSSGYFNKQLKSSAGGATELAACTSNSVDTQDTTPITDDDNNNDDNDNGLSDGEIAGIVIGVVAFCLLVGAAIYYYTNIKKNSLSNSKNSSNNNNSSSSKSNRVVEDTENPMSHAKHSDTRLPVPSLGRESLAGPLEISPGGRLSSVVGVEVDL